jgi:hypothetical protein
MRHAASFLTFLIIETCLVLPLSAQDRPIVRPAIAFDAVGSWFGRAVPVDPFCEPETQGCPVPKEIVMLPTFYADRNFVGIDSQTFGGGAHTTAHGEWTFNGPGGVKANFVFLQSSDNVFVGGFRMRLHGQMASPDLMTGKINAFFFPFTDQTGSVVLDPETQYPVPDPLTPLGEFIDDPANCDPQTGCLAVFEFTLRRVGPE